MLFYSTSEQVTRLFQVRKYFKTKVLCIPSRQQEKTRFSLAVNSYFVRYKMSRLVSLNLLLQMDPENTGRVKTH